MVTQGLIDVIFRLPMFLAFACPVGAIRRGLVRKVMNFIGTLFHDDLLLALRTEEGSLRFGHLPCDHEVALLIVGT